MDKKKIIRWLIVAAVLMLAAVLLRFAASGLNLLAYILGGAAAVIVLDLCSKNWAALSAVLLAGGAFLRFALRGYAWWGYLAAFLAALVVAHRFFSRTLWRALMVLVCIGFVYFWIVEIPIIKNARTDDDDGRDYLIVLGAAVYGDQPSLTLQRRLEGALDYLQRHPKSMIIVSGGMGAGETVPEGVAMRDWLVEQGVPAEQILVEDKATSTMENLQFSFDIIRERGDEPDGNVAICSSAYHLYRAKLMARNQGVEAAGVSAPWGYFFVMLNYFIREAFGVTHLWVFGW
jgi:uncharacterized SAM-binding protein YcdF (DUF218 family)